MYYDTYIKIKTTDYAPDEYGIMRPIEVIEIADLSANVQPITQERIQQTYGVETKANLQVFTPVCEYINEASTIEYKDEDYKIVSVIKWDNAFIPYYQFIIEKFGI